MEIRYGATRTVLLTRKYAIKVPSCHTWRSFLTGLLANLQERVFATLQDDRLCPVVFSLPGGLLVVMPRVTELTEYDWEELGLINGVTRWMGGEAAEGNYPLPVEFGKRSSFGWHKGRLVAIDYGS